MLPDAELRRLVAAIGAGSGLLAVQVSTPDDARNLVRTLGNAGVYPVFAGVSSARDPIDEIVGLAARGRPVLVAGAEVLAGEEADRWFQALNTGRDRLAGIRVPVIVLGDAALLGELGRRAPDFWSWRVGVFGGGGDDAAERPAALAQNETLAEAIHGNLQTWRAIERRFHTCEELHVPPRTLEEAYRSLGEHQDEFLVDPGPLAWGGPVRQIITRLKVLRAGTYVLAAIPGAGMRGAFATLAKRLPVETRLLLVEVETPLSASSARPDVCAAVQEAALEACALLERKADPRLLRARHLDATLEEGRMAARALAEMHRDRPLVVLLATPGALHGSDLDLALSLLAGVPCVIEARRGELPRLLRAGGAVEPFPLDPVNPRHPDGRAWLSAILARRLPPHALSDPSEDRLIELSGGLAGTLISLVRAATMEALVRGSTRIEPMDVEQAARGLAERHRVTMTASERAAILRGPVGDADPEALALLSRGWLLPRPGAPGMLEPHPLAALAVR